VNLEFLLPKRVNRGRSFSGLNADSDLSSTISLYPTLCVDTNDVVSQGKVGRNIGDIAEVSVWVSSQIHTFLELLIFTILSVEILWNDNAILRCKEKRSEEIGDIADVTFWVSSQIQTFLEWLIFTIL